MARPPNVGAEDYFNDEESMNMRQTSRTVCTLLLGALFSWSAACGGGANNPATGGIEGTVSLEGSQTAGGVEITVGGTDHSTETADDGKFSFDEVAVGQYDVEFAKQGYVTRTETVEVDEDQTATLNPTLQQVNEAPTIQGIALNPQVLDRNGTARVEVTAVDPNPDDLSYEFQASGGFSIDSSNGNEATVSAPDEFGAIGRLEVVVEDPDGASDSDRIPLRSVDNEAPTISGITAAPSTLQPGGTASVTVNANDADGESLTYEWTAPSGWSIDDDTKRNVTVTAPNQYGASGIFEVTVTDGRGVSATGSIALSTVANDGPVISSVTAAPQTAGRKGQIALDVSATDPNGDSLDYQWSAPPAWSFDDPALEEPTLTAPDQPGQTANVQVTVTDSEGLSATGSVVVSTATNRDPVVNNLSAGTTTLSRTGSTGVSVSATDPNGDPLTYSWSLGNGNWSYTGSGSSITVTAPNTPSSSTKVEVTVTDDVGGSTTASLVLATGPNQSPQISSVYPLQNPIPRTGTTDVTVQANDPNGDSLNYSWSLNNGDWSYTGSGSTITLTAPDKPTSSVIVTATVTDSLGASTSASTQVSTVSNNAPRIVSTPSTKRIRAGRRDFTYQASARDPDDSSFTWTLQTQPNSSATVSSSGLVTWTVPRSAAGTSYTFELTVNDGTDSVSQTFSVSVRPFGLRTDGEWSLGSTGLFPYGVSPAFGDFDGGPGADLAVDGGSAELSYVLSSGGYSNETNEFWFGTPNYSDCPINGSGDLDDDGDVDVVVGCDADSGGTQNLTLATWMNGIDQNNQSGTFSPGSVFNSGVSADIADFSVREIDGNPGVDVLVADTAETLHLVTNDGSGGLTFAQSVAPSPPPAAASGYEIRRVIVGAFDGDPAPDVLALEGFDDGTQERAQLALYDFASGTLSSSRSATSSVAGNPDKLAVGDLDGDGDLDAAVKTDGSPVAVATYMNDGTGSFSSQSSISSSSLSNFPTNRGIAIGQLDNDGHPDVVVGDGSSGTAHVAFGDGSGNLTSIVELRSTALAGDEFEELFLGDYNSDGLTDIFGYDVGRFVVYY